MVLAEYFEIFKARLSGFVAFKTEPVAEIRVEFPQLT